MAPHIAPIAPIASPMVHSMMRELAYLVAATAIFVAIFLAAVLLLRRSESASLFRLFTPRSNGNRAPRQRRTMGSFPKVSRQAGPI
jgi:hypothetical protein